MSPPASPPAPPPRPEPGGSGPATAKKPGRLKRHRAGLFVAALLCVVLGVGAGGVYVGWRLSDSRAAAQSVPEPSVIEVPVLPSADPAAAVAMPDVRGLREEAARQVIADAGVAADAVTTSTTPWAGPPGMVIEQTPVFGTSNPTAVTLVLSERALVPAIEGRLATDVAAELTALGVAVEFVRTYSPGAQPGAAVAIEPPPGSPLPELVTITQAQSPASVYLREVKALSGRCSAASVRIDGPLYNSGMTCTASGSDPVSNVWLLSRVVDQVTGVIGIPDTADPAMQARVEVLVDGTVVIDRTIRYGEGNIALDLTTTGALRLEIIVTNASGTLSSVGVGLGDVMLVGEPTAMATLG